MGGTVKARCFEADNQASEVTARALGLSKTGWRVLDPAPANPGSAGKEGSTAHNAIDEDPTTLWSTLQKDSSAMGQFPQDISIDMGKPQMIKAFTYLPRQDKKTEGIADRYIFYSSSDGVKDIAVGNTDRKSTRLNSSHQI